VVRQTKHEKVFRLTDEVAKLATQSNSLLSLKVSKLHIFLKGALCPYFLNMTINRENFWL